MHTHAGAHVDIFESQRESAVSPVCDRKWPEESEALPLPLQPLRQQSRQADPGWPQQNQGLRLRSDG